MAQDKMGATAVAREIPHTVSPGLWALGWKRLKSDYVGMVSLAIVAAFFVLMFLSGTGLVAKDWAKEVGTNYAPPSFLGADIEAGTPAAPARRKRRRATPPAAEYQSTIVDPLADVMKEIKAQKPARRPRRGDDGQVGRSAGRRDGRHQGRQREGRRRGCRRRARAATLPLRRRQVGPRRAREDDQGLGDLDLRRPRVGAGRDVHRHAASARSPATSAAGSTTSSTGSTTCSPRSRTCC